MMHRYTFSVELRRSDPDDCNGSLPLLDELKTSITAHNQSAARRGILGQAWSNGQIVRQMKLLAAKVQP